MRSLIAAALLSFSATAAHALDGVSFVYGEGNHTGVYGLELRSADWRQWQLGQRWRLAAYGMGSVAYWRAREESEHKELWDFAVAPVLRLERPREGATPYFEGSLGVHLLSKRQINGNREFSTAFQFGEYVAAGLLLGPRHNVGVGLRLQHISNGGIKNPNPGLTFVSVALQYQF
jgi:lipid A 3-O-deacylase